MEHNCPVPDTFLSDKKKQLLSPVVLDTLAQPAVDYSNLDISTWGSNNTTITYGYDANGSLISKITKATDTEEIRETVVNTYNLQGRLETVTTTPYSGGTAGTASVVIYTYNTQGIRVQKYSYDTDDGGTTKTNEKTTDYLIDPSNHTGYAQVLEETTGSTRTTYTIGDDVIAQYNSTDGTQYLLYDGHGSTRQLADSTAGIVTGAEYSYDGYGIMLSDSGTSGADAAANADTSMLYAGEQYDADASMYYNRARYYNPQNGLFNRVDPYAGNTQDPQSLHKYAYCHTNPVNGIDPSGYFIAVAGAGALTVGAIIEAAISIVAITAAIIAVDRFLDEFRKHGVLLHVRDKTLVRLANTCNGGAQIAGPSGRMYFQPFNILNPFDIQGFANVAVHNLGVYALIKTGLWDTRTALGIAAFVAHCPTAASAIAKDPSLGVPSREAVLIVSAQRGTLLSSFFGGGIDVKYAVSPIAFLPRLFMKHMVTLPGERVGKGKYMTIPLP